MMKQNKTKIIVGLGNPGKIYENTPHNMGNMFMQWFFEFITKEHPDYNITKWKNNKSVLAKIAVLQIQNTNIILALPNVFMNESGLSVAKIAEFYNASPQQIIIIHDDTDLAIGHFKITYGCSSAGHKGIESIMANIHTQNFWRLKIGVRPKHLSQSIYRVKAGDFVLKKMTIQNTKIIKNLYPNIAKELLRWIHNT